MSFKVYAEYSAKIEEDYDDLGEAVERARVIRGEYANAAVSVTGEGVHLTIYEIPAEVAA